ncbi:TolC family protein [Parahaliea mediterranea]|uniref:TolC family protein n=1 Tax=Parahaliea mediterranea TaxID=651086 RepID=A0A939DDY0_9GAMM|nr:TolC family protein [Parahaliea mediterranea]MBN7796463.1 TolC family protein [Parahaliea mediterranea]
MLFVTSTRWRAPVRLRAILLCVAALPGLSLAADRPLTLAEAGQRTIDQNPRLAVFKWRFGELQARRETAALRPQTALSLEAENVAGSGAQSGFESAELTLALSSVIELGGKATARVAVADARLALAEARRQAQALDLLGEVTRRFITTQALQAKLEVAAEAQALAATSHELVRLRVERGGAPEAEVLRARAEQARAGLRRDAIEAELASEKLALATLWGADAADFDRLRGNLFEFTDPGPFEPLYERVSRSPTIRVFGERRRLRQAELDLARARSRQDIGWSAGVRRFEDSGDTAMTFGISTPLFSRRRSEGEVQAAMAARSMVDYREQADLLELRARLYDAWQGYRQGSAAAVKLRDDVLPALERALEQTREAYQRGRYSYRDWIDAQRDLLDARLTTIDAASNALLNLALMEQLTGTAVANPPPSADE